MAAFLIGSGRLTKLASGGEFTPEELEVAYGGNPGARAAKLSRQERAVRHGLNMLKDKAETLRNEKSRLADQLEEHREWKRFMEQNGGYQAVRDRMSQKVFELPKITPKRLAVGGGAALATGAGLYGLNKLLQNRGEYAFLDE